MANANITKLTTEVKIDRRRTGLRPTLSEIFPNMGEKINCIIEKEVSRIPNAAGPASKVVT